MNELPDEKKFADCSQTTTNLSIRDTNKLVANKKGGKL